MPLVHLEITHAELFMQHPNPRIEEIGDLLVTRHICVIACPVRNVGPSREKRQGEKVHQFQTFYVDVS